ncbi:MAG TPA: TonB-dependent receptor [Steroidobacteraceae bacterium]|nr:TonB-dependent receptor [Steroidobacteraceae bacterium]
MRDGGILRRIQIWGGAFGRLAALAAIATPAAFASDPSPTVPTLPEVVIGTTPLPGTAMDVDKIPAHVETLRLGDTDSSATATVAEALAARLGSVAIDDTLDDAFQPTLSYRGFTASPVLGTAQGLAVYQNGARINEAFGDAVNWDLIPALAIDRVDLVGANPVYGLNALGAALVLNMKNGYSYSGGDAELAAGSFGERSAALEYGAHRGPLGVYVATELLDADGWRRFGSDAVRQLYADVSLRAAHASADLSLTLARNDLRGQGPAPIQELAIDRSLTFTGPQRNQNQLGFVTLTGAWSETPALALQGSLYYRDFRQQVVNGNTTSYLPCASAANAGLMCEPDGATVLIDTRGAPIADPSTGSGSPIGENDFESLQAHGIGAAVQLSAGGAVLGAPNQLAVGAAVDEARVEFGSGAGIGAIDPALLVEASGLPVDTPEGTLFSATPISLLAHNHYYGAYATDTLDLGSRVSATLSARFNAAEITLDDQRGGDLSGRNRYDRLNPAVGATYRLQRGVTVYAGYAETNRTPTASEIECSDPSRPCLLPSSLAGDPPALRQVVAHTVELGLRRSAAPRRDAGTRFDWHVGVFRTDLDDDIQEIASSLSSGYYRNIGATRREGLEAGAGYHSDRYVCFLSVAAIAATYRTVLSVPSPSNPYHDANGNITVEPGDTLPGIPVFRSKAGIDYHPSGRFTLGAALIAVSSSVYQGDEANLGPRLPGYQVLDLHAEYRIRGQVELFARILNATNSQYATVGLYADPTGVGAPGIPPGPSSDPRIDHRFVSPAAPLSVVAGLRLRL